MDYHIRQAGQEDLAVVAALDHEGFSPYGTAESPGTFQACFRAFPSGSLALDAGDEIAANGSRRNGT